MDAVTAWRKLGVQTFVLRRDREPAGTLLPRHTEIATAHDKDEGLGRRLEEVLLLGNEGDAPPHVHARKGDAECKYWLKRDLFEIGEAWSYNLTPQLRREVRKVIFDHFELITGEWEKAFGGET